jgi:hypothetical protein
MEDSYVPFRESTIMNLWDLPVFGTTGEIVHCTKFLISRVHNGSSVVGPRVSNPC